MTTAPFVELRFNPTDLRPGDLPKFGEYLGSPGDAIEAALAVTRTAVIRQMRSDMRGLAEPTHSQVLRIADLAWQAAFWRYRKVSAPIMADAYMRAYLAADAGDVPLAVIYELADKHAEKIGEYFHQTSRAGLADGFNTMVNRRIPAKAAADTVLDAYGLSPRQMRAFTSASQFNTPVSNVLPRSVKAKARAYIDKAFTTRIHRLSQQEEHNIDEQAKQYAWMWLQDKGRLSLKAQKLWITANDERVCPVCGPLHGQKVLVNERFVTSSGEFWTPGLHPNCRCVVRLLEHRFSKAEWDPRLHPRGDRVNSGRFVRVKEHEVSDAALLMEATAALPVQPDVVAPYGAGDVRPYSAGVAPSAPAYGTVAPASAYSGVVAPAGTTEPVATGAPFTQVAPFAEVAPFVQVAPFAEVAPFVEVAPQPEVMPKPNLAPLAPTRALSPEGDKPYYAVLKPTDQELPHDWDISMDERRFTPDINAAMAMAAAARRELIYDKVDELTGGEDKELSVEVRTPGVREKEHGYIDRVQLENTITHIIANGDPGAGFYVPLYDQDGDRLPQQGWITYNEIAEQRGIRSADFDVSILTVRSGHEDPDLTQPTQGGVQLSGSYVVEDIDRDQRDAEQRPIVVRRIKPLVPKPRRSE